MAGTITVDTVSNGAGTKTISASNLVDGSAKAWVNFNGTGTVAIRASFNVLSITDNGVGDYTVNFTTNLPDVNYTASGSVTRALATADSICTVVGRDTASHLVGSYRFWTLDVNATNQAVIDPPVASVVFFR